MTSLEQYETIIIGGGVAGLSAGSYAARDGFKTLIIEGDYVSATDFPGGALLNTPEIENYPGFKKGAGSDLIDIMRSQAEEFGATLITAAVTAVDFSDVPNTPHTVTTNQGATYAALTIILATGAVARNLNVPGEIERIGSGVSTCATCDGAFFKDKSVAVVGGGDTAVEDALFLRRYASNVTMIVRGDKLRASGPDAREALALAADDASGFNIIWNTTVEEILSTGNTLTGVTLKHGEATSNIDLDGVFIAVGRDPSTQFLTASTGATVLLDEEGYIQADAATNQALGTATGVWAAGDAVDKVYRQAVTSAGRAVEAALNARAYLLALQRG